MTAQKFIEPVSHEGDVHLIYTDAGLQPYYALNRTVRKEYDEWDDGMPTAEMNLRGEEFKLACAYDSQPLLPWEDSSYQMETTPLFKIYVASNERLSDDKPANESSRTVGGTIWIRPRWPGMKQEDGSPVEGIPNLNSGDGYLDIEVQVSNIPHEDYETLVQEALSAFDVSPGYVMEPHEASNIVDLARYVRVRRERSTPIHAADGPLSRIHGVLEAGQSGFRKHVEDHRKIPGYYVTTTVSDARARDIIKGHSLGKEIKHYYPNDPSYYEPGDALYHPKVEVSYQTAQTEETLYWEDREDALRELDETIYNILEWSGLSLRADEDLYEPDAVFPARETHRSAKVVDCPLPKVESEQERAVMDLWGRTTDSDRDLIEQLATDGGRPSREELAESSGYSYRTVRRFVQRCEEVVRDAHDGLSIDSKHKEQMLVSRVRAAEESFRESVENAVLSSADAVTGRSRSRWSETKQKYNITVSEGKYKKTLRVGYEPESRDELKETLSEIKANASLWFDSLRRYSLEIVTRDGESRQISNLAAWKDRGSPITEGSSGTPDTPNHSEPFHRRADARAREMFGSALAALEEHQRETVLEETPG